MGIRVKEYKPGHEYLKLGTGIKMVQTIAAEYKDSSVQINFTPKQMRVTIKGFGVKFIGIGKGSEALIEAMKKFGAYVTKLPEL